MQKPSWGKDQPNNYNGEQNCVVLDGGRGWLWNDVGCNLDYLHWICQSSECHGNFIVNRKIQLAIVTKNVLLSFSTALRLSREKRKNETYWKHNNMIINNNRLFICFQNHLSAVVLRNRRILQLSEARD